MARFGFRRTMLILAALVQVGYGSGLVLSHFQAGTPMWWPASIDVLAGFAPWLWGFVWLAVAVSIIALTLLTQETDWQFGLAVALNAFWALSAVERYLVSPQPGGWAVPSLYFGIAGAFVLMSAWGEPSHDV